MRRARSVVLLAAVFLTSAMQSPEPPLSEMRLSVHTLVREDIFAGFMNGNMDRFARGERNIEALMASRPDQRANLLAWKGAALVYRAVLAHEASQADEVKRIMAEVDAVLTEASALASGNDGVAPTMGGTVTALADRLPEPYRGQLWARAYPAFSALWKQQGGGIERLPDHFKGELMGGLAMAAYRTGRFEESALFVDRIISMMPGTPYADAATAWKANPDSGPNARMTCRSCHAPGRLAARLREIGGH